MYNGGGTSIILGDQNEHHRLHIYSRYGCLVCVRACVCACVCVCVRVCVCMCFSQFTICRHNDIPIIIIFLYIYNLIKN